MKGHTIILSGQHARQRAHMTVERAPPGYVVTVAEPTRTASQNDRMWAMLTDISQAKPLGRRHTPEDWKAIFMNACGWEVQFQEGLDGRPFPMGFRSSRLSKSQMTTLMDYIEAWGTEVGVTFTDRCGDVHRMWTTPAPRQPRDAEITSLESPSEVTT